MSLGGPEAAFANDQGTTGGNVDLHFLVPFTRLASTEENLDQPSFFNWLLKFGGIPYCI